MLQTSAVVRDQERATFTVVEELRNSLAAS
jgi:hypothetical protein